MFKIRSSSNNLCTAHSTASAKADLRRAFITVRYTTCGMTSYTAVSGVHCTDRPVSPKIRMILSSTGVGILVVCSQTVSSIVAYGADWVGLVPEEGYSLNMGLSTWQSNVFLLSSLGIGEVISVRQPSNCEVY